ncbi:MAG: alkyl sulfatase dimerization domain-containing protein [Actinomycetota bacterium]|nr:alkyl sulfatase dimerization domain-containing protein [Actinomycetota bacterium]
MGPNHVPASFSTDPADVTTDAAGRVAHRDLIAHGERLALRLHTVRDGVWCLVGNGLSNQHVIEGPDGLVAIDTGASVEEMASALATFREVTDREIVAVVFTHSHYVSGTAALAAEGPLERLAIWGHARLDANTRAARPETRPADARGFTHQFGTALPATGPDALVHVGLAPAARLDEHAPHTPGHVPPTHTVDRPTTAVIAGLRVELTPAPSDTDDSLTIWFPDLGVCVNNLVWPALYNVFGIRGQEYRDPMVQVRGLDHLLGLGAGHLLGAHGPPISGAARITREVTRYRDALQFLWDQTVRGMNRGLTRAELAHVVQLPAVFDESYLTRPFYGLAEHHTQQIHNGIRGWFDGDEQQLFPLPPAERARRLIDGFGGRTEVRARVGEALDDGDVRWALELATWLVRARTDEAGPGTGARVDPAADEDRALLAEVLRTIARATIAANVRNWCLTRAGELDGTLAAPTTPGLDPDEVRRADPGTHVHSLRVLLDPTRAIAVDDELAFRLPDGTAGLHVRHAVAVPTTGADTSLAVELDGSTWADVRTGRATLAAAVAAGSATIHGDRRRVARVLACFDLASLHLDGPTTGHETPSDETSDEETGDDPSGR